MACQMAKRRSTFLYLKVRQFTPILFIGAYAWWSQKIGSNPAYGMMLIWPPPPTKACMALCMFSKLLYESPRPSVYPVLEKGA